MSVIIRLASRLAGELSGIAERLPEQHLHAGDSTLVRLINKIIAEAYQAKASDFHIEPGNGRTRVRVRFRRDEALYDYITLSSRFRAALVSRIKIMSNLDISEHRHAQDGKIDFKRFGRLALELRMAIVPTHYGLEAIVLRLLAGVKPMKHQFAFAPVCLITLPQRWISVRIHSPNCSGVPATISNSTARSLSRTSGELRIFTSSRL